MWELGGRGGGAVFFTSIFVCAKIVVTCLLSRHRGRVCVFVRWREGPERVFSLFEPRGEATTIPHSLLTPLSHLLPTSSTFHPPPHPLHSQWLSPCAPPSAPPPCRRAPPRPAASSPAPSVPTRPRPRSRSRLPPPPPAAAAPVAMPVTVSEGCGWGGFAGEGAQGSGGAGQTKPPTWTLTFAPTNTTPPAHPRRPQGRPHAVVHW